MEIEELIELNLPESQTLEYKELVFKNGKLGGINEKNKIKLAREISAFANSEGGNLIIGITEDDNHNPSSIKDVGVDEDTFETWEQSFRQYITAKIRPTIHGIKINLEIIKEKNIIHIKVPKSIVKPHALINGMKEEFFIRYGNTINNMNLEDLRSAFQERDILENKVSRFKDERLSMIYSGQLAGELENKSVLVLHVVPEWSMNFNSYVNLEEFDSKELLDVFSPKSFNNGSRRGLTSYNSDGLLINYGYGELPIMSYTQIFHSATIETIEVRMMNYSKGRTDEEENEEYIYSWDKLEKILVERIANSITVLEANEIPKPYIIFVTLLNVKNKQTILEEWGDRYPKIPINRDIIKAIPAYINEENTLSESLYPLLTSLANVFGFKNSKLFHGPEQPKEDMKKFDTA
jgi:hypothetical protein